MRCGEPILGWRLWHVRPHGGDFRLESFTRHHVSWPSLSRLEASCAAHGFGAPATGHECGIYAFQTRELAEELLRRYVGVRHCYGRENEIPPPPRGRPIALGSVSLWGRILERERGYRAQYAYPYELFLLNADDVIAQALRRLYAVDVSIS
jgi:peptidoglycan/xylan/chitin deacetylase (PgdA/CDA1 family)